MNHFVLSGVNATIALDHAGITIKHSLTRREKTIAWTGVAFESALQPGDGVLVAWSDGQRYPANVRAEHGAHVLVAFPSGGEQWVGREQISRA